jgi:xanthine dehydrogenase YagS FAD-binding subunit
MKEGIVRPSRVVNLRTIPGLDQLTVDPSGALRIGALVTLAQIADSADVGGRYPALADAARHAATPQVRNAATIGGNLLQRPRCWYYRSALFHRDGADPASRTAGENQHHAIFDGRAGDGTPPRPPPR